MKLNNDDWWDALLAEIASQARADANLGVYEPPYPVSDDPTDEEENYIYKREFNKRRKELGDKFKWAIASPSLSAKLDHE